jgi:hypothetical protein
MGKTHFVSLVYHRLKQQPELKGKLLIAWLREEEYGVNSWLYLIVEILRSLGLEGVKTEEQIARLANLPIRDAEYLADRLLKELIGNQTLLIITENIDQLLFRLGDNEQWKFRSFLQETNCCSILATTPKIAKDTGRKEKPFFGFFTPIHLPLFTHSDGMRMLIKVANLSNNISLVNFLRTAKGEGRSLALHHLSSGNPRIYSLFAQVITEEDLESLWPVVLKILDELTPYYQSLIMNLGQSDDQQKIVAYLTRATKAVTVKEITAQCFISSDSTTSNALKKLRDKGYVISTQYGREVFYELSDVLMRLCLAVKGTRSLACLHCINFLLIWYCSDFKQQTSGLLTELLPKFQEPATREKLTEIIADYASTKTLPEIAVALVRNLKAVQDPKISDYTAIEWLKMWQELGHPYPELALALQMLEAGIQYKQNPKDDRIFLSLPQEMRPLLKEALGLTEGS